MCFHKLRDAQTTQVGYKHQARCRPAVKCWICTVLTHTAENISAQKVEQALRCILVIHATNLEIVVLYWCSYVVNALLWRSVLLLLLSTVHDQSRNLFQDFSGIDLPYMRYHSMHTKPVNSWGNLSPKNCQILENVIHLRYGSMYGSYWKYWKYGSRMMKLHCLGSIILGSERAASIPKVPSFWPCHEDKPP